MTTIGTSKKSWDDTALLNSWEETLAEYKKYHSIAARGEKVEDVLAEYELEQLKMERREQGHGTPAQEAVYGEDDAAANVEDVPMEEESEGDEDATASIAETNHAPPLAQTQPSNQPNQANQATANQPATGFSGLPQMVNMPGDEALKNVMMSWYYAGYYTGLYEGQQKAQQGNAG